MQFVAVIVAAAVARSDSASSGLLPGRAAPAATGWTAKRKGCAAGSVCLRCRSQCWARLVTFSRGSQVRQRDRVITTLALIPAPQQMVTQVRPVFEPGSVHGMLTYPEQGQAGQCQAVPMHNLTVQALTFCQLVSLLFVSVAVGQPEVTSSRQPQQAPPPTASPPPPTRRRCHMGQRPGHERHTYPRCGVVPAV
jgi:hypothetical protein